MTKFSNFTKLTEFLGNQSKDIRHPELVEGSVQWVTRTTCCPGVRSTLEAVHLARLNPNQSAPFMISCFPVKTLLSIELYDNRN